MSAFNNPSYLQRSAIDEHAIPENINQFDEGDNEGAAEVSTHSQAPGWYNGPRNGQWTVASTFNGSAIDDGMPTVYGGLDVISAVEGEYCGGARPIAYSLMRKLAAATEKEKKAKMEGIRTVESPVVVEAEDAHQGDVRDDKRKKGLYVPHKEDTRGIRIRARDGRKEVLKEPVRPKLPALSAQEKETVEPEKKDAKEAAAPPPASVRSNPPSRASKSSGNLVQLVGKNREEGFVELPYIPKISRPAPAAPLQKQKPQKKADGNQDSGEKAKREALVQKEAMRLRQERIAGEAMMHGALPASSRVHSARNSAKPSKASSYQKADAIFDFASKPQSVASSKTSVSHGARPQQNEWEHVPPQSIKAQSVLANPVKARSNHSPLHGWEEVGVGEYDAKPQSFKANSVKHPPNQSFVHGWEEVGVATYEAGSKKSGSRQRSQHQTSQRKEPSPKPPTNEDPVGQPVPNVLSGLHQQFAPWLEPVQPLQPIPSKSQRSFPPKPTSQKPAPSPIRAHDKKSRASSVTSDSFAVKFRPPEQTVAQQSGSVIPKDPRDPTVFAGRGWISPHPLSEPPLHARQEPDPMIQLPTGAAIRHESGNEILTYEQYREIQNRSGSQVGSQAAESRVRTLTESKGRMEELGQGEWTGDERRNISRTSSRASKYQGGSWGFRAAERGAQENFREPDVKAESIAGNEQPDPFDQTAVKSGAPSQVLFEDGDGNLKTWLRMPWDGGSKRSSKDGVGKQGNGAMEWKTGSYRGWM